MSASTVVTPIVFAQLHVPTVVNLRTVNARSVVVVGVEHVPITVVEVGSEFDAVLFPAELVAVTVARIKFPISAASKVYVLDIAPEIVE
jgi:hypothetical protein